MLCPLLNYRFCLCRYESHTKQCASCRSACRNLERLQKVLAFASVSVVALVAALACRGGQTVQVYGPYGLLVALLMAGVAAGLTRTIQKFYVEDYIHGLVN
jgi:hypothetical protein